MVSFFRIMSILGLAIFIIDQAQFIIPLLVGGGIVYLINMKGKEDE